jgi:hypothetical protein
MPPSNPPNGHEPLNNLELHAKCMRNALRMRKTLENGENAPAYAFMRFLSEMAKMHQQMGA